MGIKNCVRRKVYDEEQKKKHTLFLKPSTNNP